MDENIERGVKLYNIKRYEQALKEFKESDSSPAEDNDLAYYLGLTLTQLEQYEEGLLYLEQVVNSHTSFLHIFQSRMILGYIYSVTGRYKLAEFELKKLQEMGMESTQIFASLGFIYYCQKNIEASIETLEKAVALDPEYPNALNSLGFIYAEEKIDMKKALHYCKKAVELRPEHPAYLDSLGWAYFKNGELGEARTQLRKALNLSPGNREIARHLRAVIEKKAP